MFIIFNTDNDTDRQINPTGFERDVIKAFMTVSIIGYQCCVIVRNKIPSNHLSLQSLVYMYEPSKSRYRGEEVCMSEHLCVFSSIHRFHF